MGEDQLPSNEKYEALMTEIGEFGRFQKVLCALLALSAVPNGYFALSMVFIGRTPPFNCYGSPRSSDPVTFGTEVYPSQDQRNVTGFSEKVSNETGEANSKCGVSETADTLACPNGYVYHFDEGRTSIVTEWDLVCDRGWIKPLITSIYMGGVLVGSLISGGFADRFGRYPLFMIGTALMFVFLGLCGVATSPVMFTVFLFFAGLFAFTNYVTAFILASEIINAKDRAVTGTLAVGGFAIGYMLLPLFSYFIVDWRHLCFALASTGVFFIPYYWLMTESPRWLYTKNKRQQFSKLFVKIAVTNGIRREDAKHVLKKFYGEQDSLILSDTATGLHERKIETTIQPTRKQYSYIDLVCIPKVLPRTLCMWFIWFVCSVIYYGVAFNTSDMGGNPYINCLIAAAVEIPAYLSVMVLLKWQGRKPVLICTLLVSGLTCSVVPYLQNVSGGLAVAFAMTGKLAVSAAFDIVYIVCSELFPTLMRSQAVGSSSMAARVGGMIAPYMLHIGNTYRHLPYLFMGFLGVSAAVFYTVMPETRSSVMPETVGDLQSIKCLGCNDLVSKEKVVT